MRPQAKNGFCISKQVFIKRLKIKSSNTVFSVLPLGLQSLKYLLSDPFQGKYDVPSLHCHDTFCHSEPRMHHCYIPSCRYSTYFCYLKLPLSITRWLPCARCLEFRANRLLPSSAHSLVRKTCSCSTEHRTGWWGLTVWSGDMSIRVGHQGRLPGGDGCLSWVLKKE